MLTFVQRGIGMAYMVGPTAGYLTGFVVATGLVGWFANRGANNSPFKLFFVMLAGAGSVLAIGATYLSAIIGAEAAWNLGVMPFLAGDLFKVAIAALLVPAAAKPVFLRPLEQRYAPLVVIKTKAWIVPCQQTKKSRSNESRITSFGIIAQMLANFPFTLSSQYGKSRVSLLH